MGSVSRRLLKVLLILSDRRGHGRTIARIFPLFKTILLVSDYDIAMASRLMGKLLERWKDPAVDRPRGRIPDGERLYAIGDIHGRCDLLRQLHKAIDADSRGIALQKTIVYLVD